MPQESWVSGPDFPEPEFETCEWCDKSVEEGELVSVEVEHFADAQVCQSCKDGHDQECPEEDE